MPTPTYDLIEEKVLGSAQASVTFSSIPGTYKDLVLEMTVRGTDTVNSASGWWRINGDTGSNYSNTRLYGNGTSALSIRDSNQTQHRLGEIPGNNAGTNTYNVGIIQLFSYANTNVNKTALVRNSSVSTGTLLDQFVELWRSTSAVTSITLTNDLTNWASGCVFRLWGVAG